MTHKLVRLLLSTCPGTHALFAPCLPAWLEPTIVARFEREAHTISKLQHPNTITVFDFGQSEAGFLFLSMELLEGHTLTDEIARGPMSSRRAVHIATQICRSLDAHLNVTISFDEVARLACLPSAILLGGSREGCQAQLDACMQNTPPPLRIQAQARSEQVCYDSLAQCNASVADIESCVNVSLDAAIDFLERVSCAGFANEDVRRTAESMQTARGCADVSATCGDLGPLLL